MTSRTLFSAVALATLTLLTACGGGDASDDGTRAQLQVGGSGLTTQGVGGIGGSGIAAQGVGGIGGSGLTTQGVGGIGGSGVAAQGVGGIGGSGVAAQGVGGIGGSGLTTAASVRACSVQSVNVTIAGARVNQNGAADLNSSGWVDVALASPVRVDLMTLASGATLPLDLTTLPAGTYRQMRLLLVADDAAAPLADSVVTKNRIETALAVPSVAQGGLPLATAITVADGQVSASYQDLDVCSAVATAGAGGYQLDALTQGTTQVASSL